MIQESLNSLADGRTTLIIAHRLATIKHATRIIVVSDKGILEEGTHEQLLATGDITKALYDAQFRIKRKSDFDRFFRLYANKHIQWISLISSKRFVRIYLSNALFCNICHIRCR